MITKNLNKKLYLIPLFFLVVPNILVLDDGAVAQFARVFFPILLLLAGIFFAIFGLKDIYESSWGKDRILKDKIFLGFISLTLILLFFWSLSNTYHLVFELIKASSMNSYTTTVVSKISYQDKSVPGSFIRSEVRLESVNDRVYYFWYRDLLNIGEKTYEIKILGDSDILLEAKEIKK